MSSDKASAETCVEKIKKALKEIEDGQDDSKKELVAKLDDTYANAIFERTIPMQLGKGGAIDWMVVRQYWYVSASIGSKDIARLVKQLLTGQKIQYKEPRPGHLWIFPKNQPRKRRARG